MAKKTFLLVFSSVCMVVLFNNCSPGFNATRFASTDLASLGVCENQLQGSFEKTYYPFVRSSCIPCHAAGGRGSGTFADADVEAAFPAFMSKGYVKINQIATNAHYFSSSQIAPNSAAITAMQPEWLQGYGAYMNCMSSGSGSGRLYTIPKTSAVGWISKATDKSTKFTTITWDLEAEVQSPNVGKFQATASIDVRPYFRNSVLDGIEVKNPIIKLKAGNSAVYKISGLDVALDGSVHSDFTAFNAVVGYAIDSTGVNLATGSTAITQMPGVTDLSTFELRFHNFEISSAPTPVPTATPIPTATPPARITYAVLTGDDNFALITNYCARCHYDVNNAAGKALNMSVFADVSAKAELMVTRMTVDDVDGGKPIMPMGGPVLPAEVVDLVRKFISDGKLEK